MTGRLRQLVPEARIAIGHGQMQEHALEDVMLDFYAGKYDVLLCSTIIENGLDVPRANTMIVYDADRFGLSQLYQLRGRVGRSNRVSYAYFTVQPQKTLSETAEKRLAAIREFTRVRRGLHALPCAIWRSEARAISAGPRAERPYLRWWAMICTAS